MTVRATAAVTQRGTTHDAATLRGIFSALTPLGYDVNALIAPFGIDRSALEDKDACIASEVCEAVLAQLRAEGRVPNLPLKIAMNMPKGAQPLLDYLVASSETVGDSIDKLARFIQLVSPQTRLEIADHNDEVVVIMTARPSMPSASNSRRRSAFFVCETKRREDSGRFKCAFASNPTMSRNTSRCWDAK